MGITDIGHETIIIVGALKLPVNASHLVAVVADHRSASAAAVSTATTSSTTRLLAFAANSRVKEGTDIKIDEFIDKPTELSKE